MQNLPRYSDYTLAHHTDLGFYPLFYICKDNSCLCPDCANKTEQAARVTMAQNAYDALGDLCWDIEHGLLTVKPYRWNGLLDSEIIATAEVNYEDCSLYCDDCGKRIDSAYYTAEECDSCADSEDSE